MTRDEELAYALRRAEMAHNRALSRQNIPDIKSTYDALGYVRDAIAAHNRQTEISGKGDRSKMDCDGKVME